MRLWTRVHLLPVKYNYRASDERTARPFRSFQYLAEWEHYLHSLFHIWNQAEKEKIGFTRGLNILWIVFAVTQNSSSTTKRMIFFIDIKLQPSLKIQRLRDKSSYIKLFNKYEISSNDNVQYFFHKQFYMRGFNHFEFLYTWNKFQLHYINGQIQHLCF